MLNRKILGVAGAAMLGATAFLETNVASAVINLEDGSGAITYAKESLLSATSGSTTVGDVKYNIVTNGSDPNDVQNISGKIGFRPSTSTPVYIRYDLTNMVFAGSNLEMASHRQWRQLPNIPLRRGHGWRRRK